MATSTFPLNTDVAFTSAHSDAADAQAVGRIRLVLAVSVLLAAVIDQFGQSPSEGMVAVILSCYAMACAIAYVCSEWRLPFALGKSMHRLDVGLFFAIFAVGGHIDILPLIFLFFAIVVASLRWGLDEGARVTIASVVLYCAGAIATIPDVALPRLLLSAAVLLAFGYVIALLGERNIQVTRQLALLRDLNQVANPRFGIDRTMTAALERTRAFFVAERCIALLEDHETGQYPIRSVRKDGPLIVQAEPVNAELAHALLAQPRTHILLYRCPWRRWLWLTRTSLSHAGEPGRWIKQDGARLQEVANLLEADSFISAPLVLGRGKGRIYVTARERHLGRSDALFLAQIAAHGLLAVDRIDLLDRIASDAASLERKKLALDLHDTAIQSYIGLKLGLAALHKKADPSNPLIDDLDKLLAMVDEVIGQLRDYAQGVCAEPGSEEPICVSTLRRQTAQILASYGVDIGIHMEGRIEFGDRLAAEVLQIVREGLSNICRHTAARRGSVILRCSGGLLHIEIINDHGGRQPPAFMPRSISERAAALGGTAFVRQGTIDNTAVCVEIPV